MLILCVMSGDFPQFLAVFDVSDSYAMLLVENVIKSGKSPVQCPNDLAVNCPTCSDFLTQKCERRIFWSVT
jgi:hypothetical protein